MTKIFLPKTAQDIPFYVICRKFVNFYSIFLQRAKKDLDSDKELKCWLLRR